MIENVTPNGEITFETETRLYTVWNESYSEILLVTSNLNHAEAILTAYAKHLEDSE